jgi:23S rRNA pseudouridine1911/1915/1917 synthase
MSDFGESGDSSEGMFEVEPPLPPSEYLADQDGERLDVFVSRRVPGLSRSQVRRLIDAGLVRVDGDLERPAFRLHFGDMVRLYQEQHREQLAAAEDIPLDVRYEDDHVIVVNKQVGLTVHPAPGSQSGTLVNALLARWPDLTSLGDAIRPGLVHRLDKDTSGVLVVAKDVTTQAALQDQMRARTTQKHYLAVVAGVPDPHEGLIDAPIGRDPSDRRRMAVVEGGKASQTEYWVRERYRDAALVECRLITGRTHQIRVHMMATGHPLLGDLVYGSPSLWIDRQALHAFRLSFEHPASGERVTVEAEPPDDFEQLLTSAREDAEAHGLDIHAVDTVQAEAPKWRPSRHRARHIR